MLHTLVMQPVYFWFGLLYMWHLMNYVPHPSWGHLGESIVTMFILMPIRWGYTKAVRRVSQKEHPRVEAVVAGLEPFEHL